VHRLHSGGNFPATWSDAEISQRAQWRAAFGVTLLAPVEHVSFETIAPLSISLLFIGLTFLAFTLIELLAALPRAPINTYSRVRGSASSFLLLLSLSEHVGFGRA
jgi:inner membrane protein